MGILGLNLTRITAKMKIWKILTLVALLVAVHCEMEDVEEKDIDGSLISDEDEEIAIPEEATEVEETELNDGEMQKRGFYFKCPRNKVLSRFCRRTRRRCIRRRKGRCRRWRSGGRKCRTCKAIKSHRNRCYKSCSWSGLG